LGPLEMFIALALLGLIWLIAVGVQRFRRRIAGERWGWERVAFAALLWVLVTVLAMSALGLHAVVMGHSPPGTNPWTATPLLLIPLPVYAAAGVFLCRWAARVPPAPRQPQPPSRPAA
jgi:hypothetical protein